MRKLLLLVLLIGLHLPPASARGEAEPLAFARAAIQDLSGSRATTEALLVKVGRYYDFGILFERASQDFRASLRPEEEARLKELFAALLSQRMSEQADRMTRRQLQNPEYSLKVSSGTESRVLLRGLVNQRAVEIEMSLLSQAGTYKIVDLSIEGALLSRNYRGVFNRIFRLEGAAGLEKSLRAKLSRDKKMVETSGIEPPTS